MKNHRAPAHVRVGVVQPGEQRVGRAGADPGQAAEDEHEHQPGDDQAGYQEQLHDEPGRRRLAFCGYDIVKGPTGPIDMPAGGEVKLRFELRRNNEPIDPPPPAVPLPPKLPPE